MEIPYGFPMTACAELGSVTHGPGAVESYQSDDVLEAGRLQLLEQALHSFAFELEDRSGTGATQQFVCGRIIKADVMESNLVSVVFRYGL